MRLFDLTGEIALVTGAGSGIGREIAIAMAEAGADVACLGRRRNLLEETAQAVERFGRRSLVVEASVSDEAAVAEAVARVEAELGPLSVAVNNAGVAHARPATELTLADWQRLYDINVSGVFLCCQAEGRAMLRHGRGAIVNIASISGTICNRGLMQVHYNSSKAAVIQMTKSFAMEWADRNIRVNVISPGYTMTPMNDRAEVADQLEIFRRDTPMQRIATADEMAGPAIFLASRAASFVTGTDLIVDGGFVCW